MDEPILSTVAPVNEPLPEYEPPALLWEEEFVALTQVSDPNICAQPNPPPQCME